MAGILMAMIRNEYNTIQIDVARLRLRCSRFMIREQTNIVSIVSQVQSS